MSAKGQEALLALTSIMRAFSGIPVLPLDAVPILGPRARCSSLPLPSPSLRQSAMDPGEPLLPVEGGGISV